MTDADILLLVLVILYLLECVAWIPSASSAITRGFDGWGRLVSNDRLLGNEKGGLLLLNPLPPLGEVFLCPSTAPDTALNLSLDRTVLIRRLQNCDKRSSTLRLLCSCLFVCIFVICPLATRVPGAIVVLWPTIFVCLVLMAAIAVVYRNTYRFLYPQERGSHHLILIATFPPATIRAYETLSRNLCAAFHPLVVTSVLCTPDEFHKYARKTLQEFRFSISAMRSTGDAVPNEILEDRWRKLQRALEQFCVNAGFDLQSLDTAPMPAEASCRSYCPRCLAQFTVLEGKCADCGSVDLRPLRQGSPSL